MAMRDMPDLVLCTGGGEWSGLYIDGKLDTYGDHYLADEKIREIAGVRIVEDDAWLLGGDGSGRNGNPPPAKTLDEAHAYATERNGRLIRAVDLRAQAAQLLVEAEGLDGLKMRITK